MMLGQDWGQSDLRGSRECGLTLIEMMVTIGILAIIMAIAVPQYGDWRQSYALQGADATLVAHLKQARLMAVSQNQTVNVVFTNNSYTVESGYTNANGGYVYTYQQLYPLSHYSNRLVLTPNFPGSPSTLTFYSNGMTNVTGTNDSVTISNAKGVAKTIMVNVVGQL